MPSKNTLDTSRDLLFSQINKRENYGKWSVAMASVGPWVQASYLLRILLN